MFVVSNWFTMWNMRGIAGSVQYLRKLCSQFDLVAVSEHWLHCNRLNPFNEVSDKISFQTRASKFSSADNYGTKRGQGGVALLWSKKLSGISRIDTINHDSICGVWLQIRNRRVLNIYSVYLPSQGSPESYESCLEVFPRP